MEGGHASFRVRQSLSRLLYNQAAKRGFVTGILKDKLLICNHSKLEIEFLSHRVKYSLLMPL